MKKIIMSLFGANALFFFIMCVVDESVWLSVIFLLVCLLSLFIVVDMIGGKEENSQKNRSQFPAKASIS